MRNSDAEATCDDFVANSSRLIGRPTYDDIVAGSSRLIGRLMYEPKLRKPYRKTCAYSDDSDQHAHQCNLNRVFAVRMVELWGLGYPKSAQRL